MAYEATASCPHVFDAQTYLEVNQWVLERLARGEGETSGLRHPTAFVAPGARLVGAVQLGAGARILTGATVVGPAVIGEECTIGRDAVVARSVLWSRCAIGERSMIHSCIVANDAVVPPDATLLNVVKVNRTPPRRLDAFLPGGRLPGTRPASYAAPAG